MHDWRSISGKRCGSGPLLQRWFQAQPAALWICALELTQQPVAAFDGGIQCSLRGFLAAESLLQLVVDHIADQNERSEPNTSRIFSRRFQRDLLDRDRRAG